MLEILKTHYLEAVAILLFGIGMFTLIFHKNLIKKIMGLNIMDSGAYLFLASMGYIDDKFAPIKNPNATSFTDYINPIPAGLVLTGIVVSVSVTAIMLALTIRMYAKYHTLNIDEVYHIIHLQEKEVE